MSICLRSGARASKDLSILKYYNALKLERTFNLGLNTAKNTNYIEKGFKQKLFRIKFPIKNQWMHMFICPRSGVRGIQRLPILKYNALE